MVREFTRNEFHGELWNIMEKEINNQLPCLKEKTWEWVCEAWYNVAPYVLEELNSSMPWRIVDNMKQRKGGAMNTDFMM